MGSVLSVDHFDLKLTLESGQFFRYAPHEGGFVLLTRGNAIAVRQEGNVLRYEGADRHTIELLFQLTPEYVQQIHRLQQDPVCAVLIRKYPGLHVMRQDLHETIIGFICSSQSNIPKIRMNLHLLSQLCGEQKGDHYYLPSPGADLEHEKVLSAKTGYRAKFIVQTNRLLNAELLERLRSTDYLTAHAMLCELPGIGPKIADCICLFALGHGEAFPVDVHIIRAMRVLFPKARLTNEKKIRLFAQKRWGKDAGLAQQFIYQWARDHLGSNVGRKIERKKVTV